MSLRQYAKIDAIRGFYWLFWLFIDVFVLFQIYYSYRYLWLGIVLLIATGISTYLEFVLYRKIIDRLLSNLG